MYQCHSTPKLCSHSPTGSDFFKLTTYKKHSTNKENSEINCLISGNFTLNVVCDRYVVMTTL